MQQQLTLAMLACLIERGAIPHRVDGDEIVIKRDDLVVNSPKVQRIRQRLSQAQRPRLQRLPAFT